MRYSVRTTHCATWLEHCRKAFTKPQNILLWALEALYGRLRTTTEAAKYLRILY